MQVLLILVLLNLVIFTFCAPDTFSEELLLKPLYSDQIYAHFQFSTVWDTDPNEETFRHTHIFPRALGEIVARHNVRELHLSLTAGLWRYETWGYPVVNAAPGAEVWAWFKPDTIDVDKQWKNLANSLSGLICASLNFIDSSNTVSPQFSFRPSGVVSEAHINSSHVRYSALPREVVCTENLTPWKKLLPCDSRSGLASLLNSGYIHDTRYHSLALHIRPICRTPVCEQTSLELQQSISLVYDYTIMGTRDWSLRKLFGQGIMGPCPLAKTSVIYVDTTSNSSTPFQLSPSPDETITSIRGGSERYFAKYNVKPYPMSISTTYTQKDVVVLTAPPPLHASQYMTGYGQERGGIVLKLYNNFWNPQDVIVLQNIPWYVPVFLHTLKIVSNDVINKPLLVKYVPGRMRTRPYYLELVIRLPPRSTTSISINFEYVFLKWTEYPPDASHGFYIGSAIISAMLPLARNFSGLPQDGSTISDSFNASRSGYLVQIRTEPIVITLPTPDFSMPYNVICLACTVVALAFGPLHNITTKRLVLKYDVEEKFLVKIKNKIVKWFISKSDNNEEQNRKETDEEQDKKGACEKYE